MEGQTMQNLDEIIGEITRLEAEREAIYQDSQVTPEEHPRLAAITHELERLWDLRRRVEAALRAGLRELPVPPPDDPEKLLQ
jgi:hypothetical protein